MVSAALTRQRRSKVMAAERVLSTSASMGRPWLYWSVDIGRKAHLHERQNSVNTDWKMYQHEPEKTDYMVASLMLLLITFI